MKIKSLLENWRTGVSILFLLMAFQPVFGQSNYIRQYKPLADSLWAIYGIPVSIMLGIAIIESGAGTSRNCKLLNNHFGIKGKNNLLKTRGIRSAYKQYADARTSYIAFCRLMTTKKFYSQLKGEKDYTLWLDAISKTGYSVVPQEWKTNITAVIRKHKLGETN